jgi:predicted ATP-dependent endonuclease of OLD family
MHSDWQKKMYEVFTNQTDLQFVYSTQSENFISLKNWKQIRSISNFQVFPKEDILQEQITATDGKNGTRANYLDDYAKKNLHISTILRENLELFFAKKCVLVEGPSEKYGLPRLLELSGCNIENFSVSIIPAWGKTKIKNYQMICKVFGIDYFTIYDNDKVEDDEPTNENTAIENNAENGKKTKFSTSFEAKLGVTGDNKFQKLVKKIDEITDTNSLDQEIKTCVSNLKTFIESENSDRI